MKGLEFKMTCSMCPEQYDVMLGADQVAYVRLRGGYLSVECPDIDGELIYEAEPEGDGEFIDDSERSKYMAEMSEAIEKHLLASF